MIVEVGDYVTVNGTNAVVLRVERKPYNMGQNYILIADFGTIEDVEDEAIQADYGQTRSRHHQWVEGQQAEYNVLPAEGRTLYDQIRTRLDLGHAETYALVRAWT